MRSGLSRTLVVAGSVVALALSALPSVAEGAAPRARIGATRAEWSASYGAQSGPATLCHGCYGNVLNTYGKGWTYQFTGVQYSGDRVTGFQMNLPKRTTIQGAERRLRRVLPPDARMVWDVSGANCHVSVFSTTRLAPVQATKVTAQYQSLHVLPQDKSFDPKSVQDVIVSTGTNAAGGC